MNTNQTHRKILNGWQETRLADIGVFSKGSGIKKDQLTKTGYNAIRYGELYTRFNFQIKTIHSFIPTSVVHTAKKITYGDIVFAGSGETIDEIGKSAAYLIKEDAYAGGDTIIFRPRNANSLFLSYFLNTGEARKKLRELGQGQSVVHIYKSDIESLKLHLPSHAEQNRIVSIIETWDLLIDKLEKRIEIKNDIKKGIMHQLLTGKSRLPGFKEAWKSFSISDFSVVVSLLNVEDKPYEVLSCTKYDGLVRSLEYFDRKVYGNDLTKYKIVQRDHFAYATNHIEEGSIGYQNLINFGLVSPMYTVFKTKGVNNDFLFNLLKTPRMVFEYQRHMTASVERRGGLRWGTFSEIKLYLPTIQEQTAIANVISTANKEIIELEKKLSILKEQKRYLLNNLITGIIRTPETLSVKSQPVTKINQLKS